jgi:hypothetical protein
VARYTAPRDLSIAANPAPELSLRITPRDHSIILWVNRFGLVSFAHVARVWWGIGGAPAGAPAARRRLAVLERARLIWRQRLLWHAPSVVTCTTSGAKLVSSPLAPYVPRLFDLEHDLAVVDIAGAVTRRHPEGSWITERELRAGRITLPMHKRASLHLPDGVFEWAGSRRVAFELDRTPKSSARYERLLIDYLDAVSRGELSGLVWVVSNRSLARRIEAIIREQRAADVASVVVWLGETFTW